MSKERNNNVKKKKNIKNLNKLPGSGNFSNIENKNDFEQCFICLV
jgi:hypothetical protein